MKVFIVYIFLIVVFGTSCITNNFENNNCLKDTKWLIYDYGHDQAFFEFSDTTFIEYSVEIGEYFSGKYWLIKDTVFMYIPVPPKQRILLGSDSIDINAVPLHYIRPTLDKFFLKEDTMFHIESFNNYGQLKQTRYLFHNRECITKFKNNNMP